MMRMQQFHRFQEGNVLSPISNSNHYFRHVHLCISTSVCACVGKEIFSFSRPPTGVIFVCRGRRAHKDSALSLKQVDRKATKNML